MTYSLRRKEVDMKKVIMIIAVAAILVGCKGKGTRDFVMTRTEPNNFIPNGVVCKFVDYETIDKVLLRTINGIDGFIVEKGQFVPIPLTPSILEKNGWEHKDDIYFKEFPHRKLVIMDENAYIINECCSMFLCPAKFVPQLQHLLFGLGLNHKMEV